MKVAIILVSLCGALFLSGCESQSLMTDEEYANSRGPAPYSPDPSYHVPTPQQNPYGYPR
jgi:hypothetical protein